MPPPVLEHKAKTTLEVTAAIKDVNSYFLQLLLSDPYLKHSKIQPFSSLGLCLLRASEMDFHLLHSSLQPFNLSALIYPFTKSVGPYLILIFLCLEEVQGLLMKSLLLHILKSK